MTVIAMAFGGALGAFIALISYVFMSVPVGIALAIYLFFTLGFAVLVIALHVFRPIPATNRHETCPESLQTW